MNKNTFILKIEIIDAPDELFDAILSKNCEITIDYEGDLTQCKSVMIGKVLSFSGIRGRVIDVLEKSQINDE